MSGTFVSTAARPDRGWPIASVAAQPARELVAAVVVAAVLLFLTDRSVPAAVRAGEHRVHIAIGLIDVRVWPTSAAKSPASSPGARHRGGSGVRRLEQGILLAGGAVAGCAMWRHAIDRIRPCSHPTSRGAGCRRPVAPGVQSEPGLVVYRFGADLFYANETRFVDEVTSLVHGALRRVVVYREAGAITTVDYSAAQSVARIVRGACAQGRRRAVRAGDSRGLRSTWTDGTRPSRARTIASPRCTKRWRSHVAQAFVAAP